MCSSEQLTDWVLSFSSMAFTLVKSSVGVPFCLGLVPHEGYVTSRDNKGVYVSPTASVVRSAI